MPQTLDEWHAYALGRRLTVTEIVARAMCEATSPEYGMVRNEAEAIEIDPGKLRAIISGAVARSIVQ